VTTEIVAGAPGGGYTENVDQPDHRFVDNFAAVQSIATSHGQNDFSRCLDLNGDKLGPAQNRLDSTHDLTDIALG
jgi:hypothetical protein